MVLILLNPPLCFHWNFYYIIIHVVSIFSVLVSKFSNKLKLLYVLAASQLLSDLLWYLLALLWYTWWWICRTQVCNWTSILQHQLFNRYFMLYISKLMLSSRCFIFVKLPSVLMKYFSCILSKLQIKFKWNNPIN